jgi:hypothetical protein
LECRRLQELRGLQRDVLAVAIGARKPSMEISYCAPWLDFVCSMVFCIAR